MEKETKIINPHKMERATTTKEVHDGRKGKAAEPKHREQLKEDRELQKTSAYSSQFPNWKNGNQDIFHEKSP